MHGVGAPLATNAFAAFGLSPYIPVKVSILEIDEFNFITYSQTTFIS